MKIIYSIVLAFSVVAFLIGVSRAIAEAIRMDETSLLTNDQKLFLRLLSSIKPSFYFLLAFIAVLVIFDVKF